MPKLKLTKSTVDALRFTEKGQKVYFDTAMIGFGLVVGRTAKTYVAQRQIGTKTVRVTIGRHGIFTVDQARSKARQLLLAMAAGENPNQRRRERAAESITLQEAFEEYFQARPRFKPFTVSTYSRVADMYLSDWKSKPLRDLTPEMMAARHQRLAAKHGAPTANKSMRILRAVYNFASIVHPGLPANPVLRLTLTRAWYPEHRRQTVIKPHQLPAWYEAVLNLDNPDGRDFLLLILFSGMRRSEAQRLRWRDVDLEGRTLLVSDTKNGEPLVLPLSTFLTDLLTARKKTKGKSDFVFPGDGATGHLKEPKKFIARVRATSGIDFTLHDLRRTFITVAEGLDISGYALKRLLNHKDRRDVTGGYIVLSVERLRRPMEMIAEQLKWLATSQESEIVQIGAKDGALESRESMLD